MQCPLIAAGYALAAAPCAWACYVAGWQLVSFTGFAVRLGEDLPGEAWAQIAWPTAQVISIAAALLVGWQGVQAGRRRKAALALAVACIASAPTLVALAQSLRPPS